MYLSHVFEYFPLKLEFFFKYLNLEILLNKVKLFFGSTDYTDNPEYTDNTDSSSVKNFFVFARDYIKKLVFF